MPDQQPNRSTRRALASAARTPEGKQAQRQREIRDGRRISPFGVWLMQFYGRHFHGLSMADMFTINFAAGWAAGCIFAGLLLAAWLVLN